MRSPASTRRKTSAATSGPATIARSFAIARAEAWSFSPTKYSLVTSPAADVLAQRQIDQLMSSSEKFMADAPAVASPGRAPRPARNNGGKDAAQQGRRYKKDPGRARGETFECENVPPPESP